MKQLSSRWVITVLVAPVLLILCILIADIDRVPQAEASGGKGYVQVAFTGAYNTTGTSNFPGYQSVLLNVIAVRFNKSSDTTLSDSDSSWQTVSAPPGAVAGATSATTGNFAPNGNSKKTVRTEAQIDLARLQNNVTLFNIGKIKAITYQQVELLLDQNPGNLVPVCGSGMAEGCITYGTQLPSGFTSVRFKYDRGLTVKANSTVILTLAINAILGNPPATSTDLVQLQPEICPVPVPQDTSSATCSFSPPFSPPTLATQVAAILSGQVKGATSSGVVNAQLPGTGTIVSSAIVDSTSKRNYTMILPAGTYDFVVNGGNARTIDAWSSVTVPVGTPSPMGFTVISKATRLVSGNVNDACTGTAISGATVQAFAPPSHVRSIPCPSPSATPSPGTPAECVSDCDKFASGLPPAGCVVVATSSTSSLGAYPLSGGTSAFSSLPLDTKANYGLMATASGYNGELLSGKDRSEILKCEGSGYKDDACSFSLQHGTLQVTTDLGSITNSPVNVMVNAEDSGTFNGEGVQMLTIPPGRQSLINAPMLVPIQGTPIMVTPTGTPTATPTATATPTPGARRTATVTPTATMTSTPVVIGGAASYDLFASVQDLFGAAPQKVGGHTIAVVSGAPAPSINCAITTAPTPLVPMPCVGHGSVQGIVQSPDQNTLVVVSKDDGFGNQVDISSIQVPIQVASPMPTPNFSICEPADTYTFTHYEAQPTGSPSPVVDGSVATTLTAPTTTTATACQSICSAPGTGPTTCLLCQATSAISIP